MTARVTAAVAAGAAALVAVRLTRRSLVFARPWQVRAAREAPARQMALVVSWCLGAYLVGLLPLFTVTALWGPGSPEPLPILGVLVGFAVLTLLGYVIGAVVQNLVAGLDHNASPEERRAALLGELHGWVLAEARGQEYRDGGLFAEADGGQVRGRAAANHERLASCEVDPEDLPWLG